MWDGGIGLIFKKESWNPKIGSDGLLHQHHKTANHNKRYADELGIDKNLRVCCRAQFEQHINNKRYKNGKIEYQRVTVAIDIDPTDEYG